MKTHIISAGDLESHPGRTNRVWIMGKPEGIPPGWQIAPVKRTFLVTDRFESRGSDLPCSTTSSW